MQWETVIGLEIHAQLATRSKIFSGASTAYGADANTQACIIDLGFPGVLPVLNEAAVDMALKFGIAVNSEIASRSVFARKNYFYPDLPKGYQISQFELPIVGKGSISIDLEEGSQKVIGITRAHLEEDAGKSLHEDFHGMSGIDLNRTGTPLLEIVSEPDMRSIKEAVAYARKIHQLVVYLGICDGNMQEGSFRVDANISIRPLGQEAFGTRTELKNINSFRFMERALNYELERQIDLMEGGGEVVQETRLYDADRDETRSMRSKEEANDYRYFPDPDLLPVEISEERLQRARQAMPELPDQKRQRFETEYRLSSADALTLTQSRALADYFELVVATGADAKMTANWVTVELAGALNKAGLDLSQSPVRPKQLGGLLQRIADNTISGKLAKQVFEAIWNGEGDADSVIEAKGLKQITDSGEIEKIIDEVIAANPKQVEQFRAGKDKLLGFFVGQVMKQTQGKANPGQVNEILLAKLKG
ncbi:MAG: aspartyl/glutamyl-tRNA amidotransferase subunit B [gamma proteobacterium symbiont of Ctena orbiculata]|uniref:Aspartyl/glutamyl-tRNA(Asn/Gln) amidotransferase subunit B n=1 Tax=Candidatus Thiodiazotropha taylori TaxID=2792791 RepID=A0A944QS35_9GAMM|nr:Asp-tRNA(Asn)/Glu-tRNA(Gln) amidotransferase subunit GatB [Candidatus Thiodiazotropha taylori]PUB89464.1 MAG: Asp-tRNA(Asn)/Glu-tRNA(Gln) amidotransferase GatCAB subunit B [gamma proteobacterium symbiont of Ctena orbiculata]MBT2987617.1 Asp-tRNA(Asn)/Glu-tRNA(Gln) amidotransferase subunit GatB [Candidatus Thiodiazotropha taylori]MBT2995128.1 Asp-tRNA(Asn)/Glu-tRNA(Gln) amidotransferase subunit GatB [Candidatus Thiodiazotropha taylori]MBT2999953.1 Asp-tRNA(Asn)/Glu-tRNA(Gln) amidotransferase 